MATTPIKLGLMPPITGLVGSYGQEISRAGLIACQEINEDGGVLGRKLELIIEDDASLPETAVIAANKLVHDHQCTAIIGNLLSNSRIAVAYQVAEPNQIPYLNFSFYEGSIHSRYFFHFAALPNQQIDKMIPYMSEKYGPHMFFAGNNYEWPRGSIDAAMLALKSSGGSVIGEEYLPIGVTVQEIDGLLDLVEAAQPDVFVPYFAGQDQICLLTRFTERRMKDRIAVVMGHFDEVMASQLPPEIREGFYSSNSYFMSVDTPENNHYLQLLAKYPGVSGIWPNGNGILTNFGEGTYLCVKAFAKAANLAGSLNNEALVEALASITVKTPQGTVTMDKNTHHAQVNTYLTKCENNGNFSIVEKFGAISPLIPERYQHLRSSLKETPESDVRLQARMIEQMSEAVFLIKMQDTDIIYANNGAQEMFGYTHEELINKPLETLFYQGNGDNKQLANYLFSQISRKGRWKSDISYLKKDGSVLWCSVSVSAFTHPLLGEVWMWVQKDITQLKTLQEELLEHRKHLETLVQTRTNELLQAQAIAKLGSWYVDIENDLVQWSDETYRIFGIPKSIALTSTVFAKCIHPHDTHRVYEHWNSAKRGEKYDLEFRIIVNGEIKWLHEQAVISYQDGQAVSCIGTVQDITERKLMEAHLIASKKEAEEHSRVKNEFLANMSHELRTPLNAIIGLSQMGKRESNDDKARDSFVHILSASKHLSSIVNDLLDFSKIEAGMLKIEEQDFQLLPAIEHVINSFRKKAKEKNLELAVNIDPMLPIWITGDAVRIQQILSNLLSNAIKFTHAGSVTFDVVKKDKNIIFKMTDTGIGISENLVPLLFQPFLQADTSITREFGGTGLGLSISQTLARMMRGVIEVSTAPKKGSIFTFTMPLKGAKPTSKLESNDDATETLQLQGLRVLVAEDLDMNRMILEDLLEYEGAEVVFAENGKLAIDRVIEFGENYFDIVLMDIQMPIMDGYQSATNILALAPKLPIIGVTAHALKEDYDRCINAGMVEHITKPIDPDLLIQCIIKYTNHIPSCVQEAGNIN